MLECDDAGEPSEAQASSPHSLPHSHLHLLLRASRLLPLPSTEALELGKLNRLSHPSSPGDGKEDRELGRWMALENFDAEVMTTTWSTTAKMAPLLARISAQ